jgi:hypothetical protein
LNGLLIPLPTGNKEDIKEGRKKSTEGRKRREKTEKEGQKEGERY